MSNGLAVGLGEDADQEDQRGDRLREQVPGALLRVDHRDEAEALVDAGRGGREEDGEHRQAHRQFIGDELRRAADGAEEGELRVGGPAGERDAVDAEELDGEHQQHADVGALRQGDGVTLAFVEELAEGHA
jgi:hypothetical protein